MSTENLLSLSLLGGSIIVLSVCWAVINQQNKKLNSLKNKIKKANETIKEECQDMEEMLKQVDQLTEEVCNELEEAEEKKQQNKPVLIVQNTTQTSSFAALIPKLSAKKSENADESSPETVNYPLESKVSNIQETNQQKEELVFDTLEKEMDDKLTALDAGIQNLQKTLSCG